MPPDFTGERYVPGVAGEIAYEHWHRYAFARRFAAGRRVLDVGCGTGDLTLKFARELCCIRDTALPPAQVIGVDFTYEMLPIAAQKAAATHA